MADLLDRLLAGDSVTAPAAAPRVVFLARDLEIGGAERGLLTYVNCARSIEPSVALLRRGGLLLPELRPDVTCANLAEGFPAPGIPLRVADRLPGATYARLLHECRRLAAVLRSTRAGVVSAFLMRSHLVALLTRRLYAPHVRVVLNIHEHWSESAPHLYRTRLDRWMMRWITRHLFPEADRIVTVSRDVRDDLIQRHGARSSYSELAQETFQALC